MTGIVFAAMLTQNLRPRGPFYFSGPFGSGRWDAKVVHLGWPFPYFEQIDETITFRAMFGPETQSLPTTFKRATFDIQNQQFRAACGDIALSLFMVSSTVCVCEYWRRHRRGPFQFGLRTLLIVTAIVACLIALIDHRVIDWWSLLYLPLAFGLVSVPAVVGLALEFSLRRSDQRLSQLRSRHKDTKIETEFDTQIR